jgi:hypothetical protein
MELLVRWACPRCSGKTVPVCELCGRSGYMERWLPARLVNEALIRGRIVSRRSEAGGHS